MSNYPRPGSGSMEANYARDQRLDADLHTLLTALDVFEGRTIGIAFDENVAQLSKRVREERARLVRRYD